MENDELADRQRHAKIRAQLPGNGTAISTCGQNGGGNLYLQKQSWLSTPCLHNKENEEQVVDISTLLHDVCEGV